MRRILSSSLAAAVAIGFGGCATETKPGGPGAVPTEPRIERSYRTPTTDEDRTFTLEVPRLETNLKRGEQQDVTIQVNRGSEFREAVTVRLSVPPGLTVNPAEVVMDPDDNDAKITIGAAADAPTGSTEITVTGTPRTGKAVSAKLPVEVKNAD